jgi:hypothetical protein
MKPWKGNPVIMGSIYELVRSHIWLPDPNPTVDYVPGKNNAQNNYSDQWSQGPNGYPGMPPAGGGNSNSPLNPYTVSYPYNKCNQRNYYTGPVPPQNINDTSFYANQLSSLSNTYTTEWLNSIDPIVAAQLNISNIQQWDRNHNDTTPLYRTGGRCSQ